MEAGKSVALEEAIGEPGLGRLELGLEGDGEGGEPVQGALSDRFSELRLRELCPGRAFLYPSGLEGPRPGRGRGVNELLGEVDDLSVLKIGWPASGIFGDGFFGWLSFLPFLPPLSISASFRHLLFIYFL